MLDSSLSHAATTYTAATCAAADVQAKLDLAITGDTVIIPAGSCSWDYSLGELVYAYGRNLKIQGAGIDVTTITTTATAMFINTDGNGGASEVSNMTISAATGGSSVKIDGQGWRVHHMKLKTTTSGTLSNGVLVSGAVPNTPHGPTGLIDHIQFIDSRVDVYGFGGLYTDESGSLYVSSLGLGDSGAVFIEDSTYTFNGAFPNIIDCNTGGHYTLRFNTIVGPTMIESHSFQGPRSCRRWEIYHNDHDNQSGGLFSALFIRGGSGVIFNHVIHGAVAPSEPYLQFDNIRSFEPRAPLGQCDGDDPGDGNQHVSPATDAGWPCRDQIGWAQDSTIWLSTNTPDPPAQLSTPAYLWNNTMMGSPAQVQIRNFVTPYIQPNRDYYLDTGATCSGSACSDGVGVGARSSRPANCTTGTAWWATDGGTNWNTTNGGGVDGGLDKCTATNTWTNDFYVPYTYPHPLNVAEPPAETTGAGIKGSKGLGLF